MIKYILLTESKFGVWDASIINLKQAKFLLKESDATYCIFKVNVKDPQNFALTFPDPPYFGADLSAINLYNPATTYKQIIRVYKTPDIPDNSLSITSV